MGQDLEPGGSKGTGSRAWRVQGGQDLEPGGSKGDRI